MTTARDGFVAFLDAELGLSEEAVRLARQERDRSDRDNCRVGRLPQSMEFVFMTLHEQIEKMPKDARPELVEVVGGRKPVMLLRERSSETAFLMTAKPYKVIERFREHHGIDLHDTFELFCACCDHNYVSEVLNAESEDKHRRGVLPMKLCPFIATACRDAGINRVYMACPWDFTRPGDDYPSLKGPHANYGPLDDIAFLSAWSPLNDHKVFDALIARILRS